MSLLATIKGSEILVNEDGSVTYVAGATLDGDGANGQFGQPPCYAPASYQGTVLDYLANAGAPGNWWGVVTDTGDGRGEPVLQGPNDPCPGAYISTTTLELPAADGSRLPNTSPFKYVDSATVPFIVVPPVILRGVPGVVLGSHCVVTNQANGAKVDAVVADIGPGNHLGEMSLACAEALGIRVSGRHEADSAEVDTHTIHYQIFPGQPAVVKGVTYPLHSY